MTLNDNLRVPDYVATRRLGDETVLLNLETGIYFGLNPVGSRFLELLEHDANIAAAYHTMLQEFEVAPEVLANDLLQLAEQLQSKRLIDLVR